MRTIDRTGGTFLHTSRTNPSRVRLAAVPSHLAHRAEGDGPFDFTDHALRVIESLGIDVLIPIGGDDTLSYALRMREEGVPVVAIPKTMDNDVHGTDYCIGFSTAITRGVQFIHNLRTSTGSHERIAVVELFGRYSGETSLITAYLAGVDRAIISEVPFDIDRLGELLVADTLQPLELLDDDGVGDEQLAETVDVERHLRDDRAVDARQVRGNQRRLAAVAPDSSTTAIRSWEPAECAALWMNCTPRVIAVEKPMQ